MDRKSLKKKQAATVSAEEFVRTLLGVEVGYLLKFDPIARRGRDPEGVHQLRVSARRLRSELKVVAPVWKAKPLRRLERELQWFGQILGERRDLDVLREVLTSINGKISPPMDSSVFGRLHEQRRAKGRRVLDLLESQRYLEMVGTLSQAVVHPPLRSIASEPMRLILRPAFDGALTRIFSTVDSYGADPTNDELHRIRILAKQGRYSAEVAGSLLGETVQAVGESLKDVQTVLGDVHDRLVAIAYLDEERSALRSCGFGQRGGLSLDLAVRRLGESIEELKTKWREPLERARSLNTSISGAGATGSEGSGVQHEIEEFLGGAEDGAS